MISVYEYANAYESYLDNKIINEYNIAVALNSLLPVNEAYANVRAINEAKIGDKIKVLWQRFVTFIKSIGDKFMEAMRNILVSNKKYLERYKDIILKKKGKDGLTAAFNGDYKKGVERIRNTSAKLFNAAMYESIKQDVDAGEGIYKNTIKEVMSGNNGEIEYDEGDKLADIFKRYFIAGEAGEQEKKFSELNFTDMYNFCYNFEKIEAIVKKDNNILEQNVNAITQAVNKIDSDTVAQPATASASTSTGQTESAMLLEEPQGQPANNNQGGNNAEDKGTKMDLKITSTNTDFTKGSDSYKGDEKDNAGNEDNAKQQANELNNKNKDKNITLEVISRFKDVQSAMITAKLTACQHIAEDFMRFIREHIKSYGGEDIKDLKDKNPVNKATNYEYKKEETKKNGQPKSEKPITNDKGWKLMKTDKNGDEHWLDEELGEWHTVKK